MGKYQLDARSQAVVAKYQGKHKHAQFDKKQHLEKIRAEYLKKKLEQADQ